MSFELTDWFLSSDFRNTRGRGHFGDDPASVLSVFWCAMVFQERRYFSGNWPRLVSGAGHDF